MCANSEVIVGDLFKSFKVCSDAKGEWGAESNGKLPNLFIPGKTAALVPEFGRGPAFGRIATLVPALAVKDLSLGRTL